MYAKGQTISQWIEQLAPKSLAVPDDKIGLQVGTLNKEIKKVLVALDITEAVVEEAIAEGVQLIVAHHAVIYRPLAHVMTDFPQGRIVEKLLKHDIAVYIAHTNLDVASGGLNDWLAERIGLEATEPLDVVVTEKLWKLVVYVPLAHQQAVLDAMFAAGAGAMGHYSHCSFSHAGVGTFLPREGAQPHIGQVGKVEHVDEQRIEVVVLESLHKPVIQAMKHAHPYEEVAYDLFELKRAGAVHGLGRIGAMAHAVSLRELVARVKQAYDVPMVRVVGNLERPIRRVAVLGGSGGRYARRAEFRGADAYITGDIDYHVAHDALASGLAIIDVGHNVEKIMKTGVADYLMQEIRTKKLDTEVIASQVDTEPFQFV